MSKSTAENALQEVIRSVSELIPDCVDYSTPIYWTSSVVMLSHVICPECKIFKIGW